MKRFQPVPQCGFVNFHIFFFMNITVKTVHICRFTDRYYLWNDRFSVLSQRFCPFKGFLDLINCRPVSLIWSENLSPWPISIVCSRDCYWLLVFQRFGVCWYFYKLNKTATSHQGKMEICYIIENLALIKTRIHRTR